MTRRVSVWGGGFWLSRKTSEAAIDAARELDALGYSRLWTSGGFGDGLPSIYGEVLAATPKLGVASGIISIWHADPADLAKAVDRFEREYPGRFLLGLGASHGPVVEATDAGRYTKPYSRMVEYLDALDATSTPVPAERLALAALGPRMLTLSAERTAGAHPYFVPAEHTAQARAILGDGPLLAPEVAWCSTRTKTLPAESLRSTCGATCRFRTTPTTSCVSVTPRMMWRERAATGCVRRSFRRAASNASSPGSNGTTRPAPTRCPSRY